MLDFLEEFLQLTFRGLPRMNSKSVTWEIP